MQTYRFSGNLVYDGLSVATQVRRFHVVGDEMIIVDLTNPAEGEGGLATRFFGILERQLDGTFKSGWTYLSSALGADLPDDSEWGARIVFEVVQHQTSSEVRVEGKWITFEKREFPFHGLLNRVESPATSTPGTRS